VPAALALLPLLLPAQWSKLVLSPYKSLSQTLRIDGAHIAAQHTSPLGLLTVVANEKVPLREAPGLSIRASVEPPAQLAVFTDGDAMTTITQNTADSTRLGFLDELTSALPYHLSQPQRVLILGAGGGMEVLQARFFGTKEIHGVELNPQIIALLREKYAEFSGQLYTAPGVSLQAGDIRGYISDSNQRFDLIQMNLVDAAGGSAGLRALTESYLYTIEALQQYLAHLTPDGMLAITRWVDLPPRDALKLIATVIAALERSGSRDPSSQLAVIRGWQTVTVIVKNNPLLASQLAVLQQFCADRGYDTAYYPGMPAAQANRRNVLHEAYFYDAVQALLGPQRDSFLRNYKFNLEPATDDKPYYFQFFKWASLAEILSLLGQGGMSLLQGGYLVLLATLAQAVLFSLLLILLPLWWRRQDLAVDTARPRLHLRTFGYFSALGLAFLFLEIAMIQKFILVLHHPVYAISAILCGFLVFAGFGSACSQRFASNGRHRTGIRLAVAGIVGWAAMLLLSLDWLVEAVGGWPLLAKVSLSLVLLAPLAFCMGMPFPLGVAFLHDAAPPLLPWVWAVNGCASVISAVLATLIAVHCGFTVVVLLAMLLYALAGYALPPR
jgi:spermidine synthase